MPQHAKIKIEALVDYEHFSQEDSDYVVFNLSEATRLTKLRLDNHDLSVHGKKVAEALRVSNNHYAISVQDLSLRRCRLGEDVGIDIAKAVATGHPALRSLNLSGNRLSDAAAAAIAQAVKATRIHRLLLANNRFTPDGASALAQAITDHKELTQLSLAGNGTLGDAGARRIAEALANAQFSKLEILNLDACGLSIVGRPLAAVLRSRPELRSLSLAHNELLDDATICLSRALEDQCHGIGLTYLNLSDNRVGPDGAAALGAALMRNDSLLLLALAGNDSIAGHNHTFQDANSLKSISAVEQRLKKESELPRAAQALADGLRANKALTELDLRRCAIGSLGASAFTEAITSNPQLSTLRFESNRADPNTTSALLAAVANRSSKKSLRERHDALLARRRKKQSSSRKQKEDESTLSNNTALPLEPGQTISVPVSYGRRHNIVGRISCSVTTTLAEARSIVDSTLDLGDADYLVLSVDGKRTFPHQEEDKRQVLLDAGRILRLRPSSWLDLGSDSDDDLKSSTASVVSSSDHRRDTS